MVSTFYFAFLCLLASRGKRPRVCSGSFWHDWSRYFKFLLSISPSTLWIWQPVKSWIFQTALSVRLWVLLENKQYLALTSELLVSVIPAVHLLPLRFKRAGMILPAFAEQIRLRCFWAANSACSRRSLLSMNERTSGRDRRQFSLASNIYQAK